MSTTKFLEYLQEHPATHTLGDALAFVLGVRGVPIVPAPARIPLPDAVRNGTRRADWSQ